MAITKEKKEALLKTYSENIEKSSAIFLTDYKGITVNEMTDLRKKLREAESAYAIVKNTLVRKAFDEAGVNSLEDLLSGPVGVSFCFGEAPTAAKALVEFAKDVEIFEIKGGVVGNDFVDADGIKNLADLPPLDVLRAQLLGVIAAPASQIAGVISGGVRQVVNVVDAYAKSEESDDS